MTAGFNPLCTIYPEQQQGIVIIANDVARPVEIKNGEK
jgi:hypothetical protein